MSGDLAIHAVDLTVNGIDLTLHRLHCLPRSESEVRLRECLGAPLSDLRIWVGVSNVKNLRMGLDGNVEVL